MNENRHRTRNDSQLDKEENSSISPLNLIKKEQDYRHKWQDKYTKSTSTTFRLGQICGLTYNLALLYLVYDLVQDGEKDLAFKLFVLNLVIIGFGLLVTSVERKILFRKPARKSRNDNKRLNRNNSSQNRSREPREIRKPRSV
jgi:hypothetical protein